MSINIKTIQEVNSYENQLAKINLELLSNWLERFSGNSYSGNFEHETLKHLLIEFQEFSIDYFDFVKFEIVQNSNLLQPEIVRRYMYQVIENLRKEWDIISRACVQRENKLYRDKLELAEHKAKVLYERFTGYRVLMPDTSEVVVPITYFGKLFSITRYLFTPYPILSIPINLWGISDSWNGGLAHELGHHLYWNSLDIAHETAVSNARSRFRKNIENSLALHFSQQEKIKELQDIWDNWAEELFADLCGALLLGPNYAYGTFRLLDERVRNQNDLLVDDREHPIFLIRPLIAIIVLQWVANQQESHAKTSLLQGHINKLKTLWDSRTSKVDFTTGLPNYPDILIQLLVESAQKVVNSLLTDKTWVDAQREPVELSSLFNCVDWLNQLTPSEFGDLPSHIRSIEAEEAQVKFEPRSAAFKRFQRIIQEGNKHPQTAPNEGNITKIDDFLSIELGQESLWAGCYEVTQNWYGRKFRYLGSC